MRDDMREQLIADKMRSKISEGVTITPAEVRKFFNRIPKDSLPFFSEEVEVAQIVKIARPKMAVNCRAGTRAGSWPLSTRRQCLS